MKYFLAVIIVASLVSGCIKNNPDPSWITINEWTIEANPNGNNAGVLTMNFPYAWVYVNGEVLGVFELPCTVPVLASGAAEIRVYPAILDNGISATKKIYPFVEDQTINAVLIQNEALEINPVTRYVSTVKFHIQDFEGANTNFENTSNSTASLILQGDANNSYGRVLLNSSQDYWEAFWNDGMPLTAGQDAYLEIDYYNTNLFTQGIVYEKQDGSTGSQANIGMPAQADDAVVWKKIYIDLTELVGVSQGVYFVQTFQAKLDEGDSQGLIYIDNIKIVYY